MKNNQAEAVSRGGKVASLDDYRKRSNPHHERQNLVMEVARDVLLRGERTPVAIAGVSINPLGEVVSSAAGVEPEHVGPMIEAMQRLIERMRAFADKGVQAVATWAMLFGADIVLEPAIAAALDVAASTAQL